MVKIAAAMASQSLFLSLQLPFSPKPTTLRTSHRSRTRAVPEQDILRAVADSEQNNALPCVRTFENSSARLSLVAAVDFNQALTAAAADGGCAASEHLLSDTPAMVVETVFPCSSGDHSTVSTRLFLPAEKVEKKARKLRTSLGDDILSAPNSKNILAMTFRQVVLQQLWSSELVVFRPGSERDMENLENPREVSSASLVLSSSDERLVSALAEAVCVAALQSTERNFLNSYLGRGSSANLFRWMQKPRSFASKDSSVVITKVLEDEIVENAKSLVEDYNSARAHFKPSRNNLKYTDWMASLYSKLEKIGGPQFSSWTREYIPAYSIQVDVDRFKGVKFEGWRQCSENKWEVLLTHSQMVGLTDTLDMYYEDPYTLRDKKELSYDAIGSYTNLPDKKRTSLLMKVLCATLASGVFLIAISALGRLSAPRLTVGKFTGDRKTLPSSEVTSVLHQSVNDEELESFCIIVVKTIKDRLDWHGDITCETGVGVWTGNLPEYLRMVVKDGSENVNAEIKTSAQDIASYQVLFSVDGKLVGFQPTSRVAVNQWAANPLARELYGGRKLSPSLLEPGLKVHHPDDGVVVVELLMSINPDACFALARPSR